MQEYLVENLKKGFIRLSDLAYLLLVLFVKKKDRSLCFYINYQQLNILTKKDWYPILLISKTLN